jgi:Icc-related predicted phosphoesterase
MKLYAISDLHVHYEANRKALKSIKNYRDDWLILGGDMGEKGEHHEFVFDIVCNKFDKVFWVPGNHDLWTIKDNNGKTVSGIEKYQYLLSICRRYSIITPEDNYVEWPGDGHPCVIIPLFNLYDYSFSPDDVTKDNAIKWAMKSGIVCNDEYYLKTSPYESILEWCDERISYSEKRLEDVHLKMPDHGFILINHFPLRYEHVQLFWIPRFSIWCGTKKTENWHRRFPVHVVVYGHIHYRATHNLDKVRFEEVSLGYPKQWTKFRKFDKYFREILPGKEKIK